MDRVKSLFIVVLCFVICPACRAEPGRATRVLFIGNSYTYFNNLPELFAKLANAGHQGKVETYMEAPGGWTLRDHWLKGEARKILEQQKWDFVVLQDQSTLGMDYWVEGKDHAYSDVLFKPYAEKWAAEIRAKGAKPVFFMTWASKNLPEDQAALAYAYTRVAKETHSLLAPVGLAWQSVRGADQEINLFYEGHGNHPSPAGSYLAACILYATVFQQSPLSLPSKISGTPVDLDTEKPEIGKNEILVDLSAADAATLQNAAQTTWQFLAKHGGYPAISEPPRPSVQPLPIGIPFSMSDLEGDWKGTILFYPVGPVDMVLHVRDSGCRLEIQYHSKDFPDESVPLSDLNLAGGRLRFTGPKSAGVDNLAVRFIGILTEQGKLRGTSDSSKGSGDEKVILTGSWSLTKQ